MTQVDIHEAKTHLSRLLARVRAGETIVIAKRGTPCARLCPLEAPEPRRSGLLHGQVGDAFVEPLPDAELDAWEA